jgi:polyhydroxybutyrate depolymerase
MTHPLPSPRTERGTPLRRMLVASAILWLGGCTSPAPETGPLPTDGAPGTYALGVQHDGAEREAVVYVPESYDAAASTPLLLNFHGFGGTSLDHMAWADMRGLADTHGFVLAYPQGSLLDGAPHWNTSLPSADNKSSADDFGFMDALIDTIAASYAIDADRIYAAGYSNGGMFSFALACFRSERIAAVASVSGAMLDDIGVDCTPDHPTSVITLHGTDDSVIDYEGGEFGRPAEEVIAYWVDHNGITGAPETATSTEGGDRVESALHTGGEGGTEVHHHRVVGGGHEWFDLSVDGADTNTLVWDFVSRFGRSGAL